MNEETLNNYVNMQLKQHTSKIDYEIFKQTDALNQAACCICMSPFPGETLSMSSEMKVNSSTKSQKIYQISTCSHIFHKACIHKWFKHNIDQMSCPVCKFMIPLATESSLE